MTVNDNGRINGQKFSLVRVKIRIEMNVYEEKHELSILLVCFTYNEFLHVVLPHALLPLNRMPLARPFLVHLSRLMLAIVNHKSK